MGYGAGNCRKIEKSKAAVTTDRHARSSPAILSIAGPPTRTVLPVSECDKRDQPFCNSLRVLNRCKEDLTSILPGALLFLADHYAGFGAGIRGNAIAPLKSRRAGIDPEVGILILGGANTKCEV